MPFTDLSSADVISGSPQPDLFRELPARSEIALVVVVVIGAVVVDDDDDDDVSAVFGENSVNFRPASSSAFPRF